MKHLNIELLDYVNHTNEGYRMLPSLKSLNDITDLLQVYAIRIAFETEEQAIQFSQLFPKSYKAKVNCVGSSEITYYQVYFQFNTFFTNNTTGLINETAINNRLKVIKKLKEII